MIHHSFSLIRSLILASFFSFIAPMLAIAIFVALLLLVGALPGLEALSEMAIAQVSLFLKVFGNGSPVQGLMLIGLVCSFVGVLFDSYILYRDHKLRGE
jgi:hypothetical protein